MIYGGDITKSILSRLEVLEKAQAEYDKQLRIWKAQHSPFVEYEPWDMLKDEYRISYFPEGIYQAPNVLDKLGYEEVKEWFLKQDPEISLQIHMGSCTEWLYVFHRFDKRHFKYTEQQLDMISSKWLADEPQLKMLHDTEEGKEIVKIMMKLPQQIFITVGDYQKIIKGER